MTQNETKNGSKVKLAVVGMGYWGKNLVRNFTELGALSVVCDSNTGIQEALSRDYPNIRFRRDFGVVLSDSTITAVALATPAVTHHDMAKAALLAGKDVYVEKPLAIE